MSRLSRADIVLVKRGVFIILFKLLRLVFNIIQSIAWLLNGTYSKVWESFKPENYDHCAQVVDVVLRYQFDPFQQTTLTDYIYAHKEFINPRYIFDNDDVTLLTVTEKVAIFCESKQKGMRLWKSEYSSFVRFAQVENCNKLILVPRYAFHSMAEELGDPPGKLLIIFNVTRCGSTLLTQMLEYTEQCVALSEPDFAYYATLEYRKKGSTQEVRELARDAVRWTCRPYHDFKPLAYCVKLTGAASVAIRLFKEVFPESKCIFMYRDTLTVAKSFNKLSYEMPMLHIAFILGRISASGTALAFDGLGVSGKDFRIKQVDHHTLGILGCIVLYKQYLELLDEGFDVVAIRYEDIISDSTFACKQILKYMGLPESLSDKGIRGLSVDSQRNSILSKKRLSIYKDVPITAESKASANRMLKKDGLPTLDEETLLRGTITVKPENK